MRELDERACELQSAELDCRRAINDATKNYNLAQVARPPAHMLTALTRPVPSPVFSSPLFYSPSSAVSSVPQFHFLPRSSFLSSPALFLFSLSPFSPVSCVNSTRLHIRVFFRPFFQFLFFLFSLGLSDFCRCHSSSLHVSVPVTAVVQISPEF